MKMHSNTAGSTFLWAQHALGDAVTAVGHTATRIRKSFKNLWSQIQIGRMQSVLQAMNDEQLHKIGIERSGIREYAEHLVTYEYDGL
ncbi:hypothetical protein OAN307_c20370 [Octadecabacter antarcticus 307]|uniref:DUF1127 family protein n=1 Tax=Octadecabacter antarcticus 307 TaxID=391626 RepID=M9R629_9RHOB|nr:hypothetical protein [Octadecabacter antarcticus]AGI67677.1 hypothetical protein OAN307_c20370 [Octadecabacter antarcticus 307]